MFRIKYSREVVLKILYLMEVTDQWETDPRAILRENRYFFKGLNKVETEFVFKLIRQVASERESIDRTISEKLIGWRFSRLKVVERNLLRMGMGEAAFNPERVVIIDDLVRMAKKYGDTDSYRIVNAVLDKVVH